jgi:hypothetical protein
MHAVKMQKSLQIILHFLTCFSDAVTPAASQGAESTPGNGSEPYSGHDQVSIQ